MATNLTKIAPPWQGDTMVNRFEMCRLMLLDHGLLSDGESDRVRARLEKMLARRRSEQA